MLGLREVLLMCLGHKLSLKVVHVMNNIVASEQKLYLISNEQYHSFSYEQLTLYCALMTQTLEMMSYFIVSL